MSYLKAIVAGVGSILSAGIIATADNGISLNDGFVMAAAGVGTFAAVYFTPNEAPDA
jgi:hypothetical protein